MTILNIKNDSEGAEAKNNKKAQPTKERKSSSIVPSAENAEPPVVWRNLKDGTIADESFFKSGLPGAPVLNPQAMLPQHGLYQHWPGRWPTQWLKDLNNGNEVKSIIAYPIRTVKSSGACAKPPKKDVFYPSYAMDTPKPAAGLPAPKSPKIKATKSVVAKVAEAVVLPASKHTEVPTKTTKAADQGILQTTNSVDASRAALKEICQHQMKSHRRKNNRPKKVILQETNAGPKKIYVLQNHHPH